MAMAQVQQWPVKQTSIIDEFERTYPNIEHACVQMIKKYDQRGLVNDQLLSTFLKISAWHQEHNKKWLYNVAKRLTDITFALLAIILLSPFLGIVAIAIKLESVGPVFYRQVRVGQFCRPFWITKFRTMYEDSERKFDFYEKQPTLKLVEYCPPDARITGVGRFLRAWSIDELPQLWDILLGNMSIIGPRPLSIDDTSTIPEEYAERFALKPGLGGLWQATTPDEKDGLRKVAKDCEYVKIRSWLTDMKLVLGTLMVALKGRCVR